MKNSNKNQMAAITIALLMASGSSITAQSESTREAAGDVAKPQTSSPTDFVDTLNSKFGKQTTNRATHAKGVVGFGKVYAERICAKPEHGCAFPALRSYDLPVLG
jgi:hypothetical protein